MTLWQKEGRDIWLLGLRGDIEVIRFCLGSFVCGMMISLEKATIVLAAAVDPGRNSLELEKEILNPLESFWGRKSFEVACE